MLFEAHGHFQEVGDMEQIRPFLFSAPFQQIGGVLNCTVSPREWGIIREMADMNRRVVPFYGVHPWKVLEAPSDWQAQVAVLLQQDPRAGVGECGLDKVQKDVDMEKQKNCLRAQIGLAKEFRRPYVVHCVRAWDWTVKILEKVDARTPFILHFFNGPKEIMEKLIRLGGYISFNARQKERTDDRVRELIKIVPPDRLLLETDFPYLGLGDVPVTPEVYLARLEQWYAEVAGIKGMPLEKFIEVVADNGKIFTHPAPVGN